MAIVKICPTCGLSNVPISPFCSQCRVSLVAVAPSEDVRQATEQFDSKICDTDKIVCPECKAENEAGSKRCVYCDCAMASTGNEPCNVELAWPWGKERLRKLLRIGREPPSPENLIKAIHLHGFDNISRSHAELSQDPVTGVVSVIDLGSTNGTFVDGVRILPHKPTALRSGAIVRFASNLSVTVVLTRNDS
jgi:hypothetical protein